MDGSDIKRHINSRSGSDGPRPSNNRSRTGSCPPVRPSSARFAPDNVLHGHGPDYKPAALRLPFIVGLTVVILALIGVLEYSCHTLPLEGNSSGAVIIINNASSASSQAGTTFTTPTGSGYPTLGARSPAFDRSSFRNITRTRIITESRSRLFTRPSINPSASDDGVNTPKLSMGGWGSVGDATVTEDDSGAQETELSDASGYIPLSNIVFTAGAGNGYATQSSGGYVPGAPTATVTSRPTLLPKVHTGSVVTTVDGVETTVVKVFTLDRAVSSITGITVINGVASNYVEIVTVDTDRVSSADRLTAGNTATAASFSYVTARVSTLTDSRGVPTETVTYVPAPISTPTIVTLRGPAGYATATYTTSARVEPVTTVLTNSAGVATATVTEYPIYPSPTSSSDVRLRVYSISNGDYFIGFYLPTLISVVLTIPIRMIDLSAKQLQPFHELTHPLGAPAHQSLCLRTGGFFGLVASVRSLIGGQALVFLTTNLTLCSLFLVPLSSEAIALKLHGKCSQTNFRGCAMTLGVFPGPARATMGVLAGMALLLLGIVFVLRKWRSGVSRNPWSITGVASLATNQEVRDLFATLPTGRNGQIKHTQLVRTLDKGLFRIGPFLNQNSELEYGVYISRSSKKAREGLEDSEFDVGGSPTMSNQAKPSNSSPTKHHLPFLMLSYTVRIVFLVLLSGLMAVILYYNETFDDTPFERFMDTQSFGVRFLFTLVGIGITFFWTSFFTNVATVSPYYFLSRGPQQAGQSILLSPPTNAFAGIVSAVRRRHPFLIIVASTAILSEFMPILLNNIPRRLTQTWTTHMVCTWAAMGIMAIMWLVVAGSFFIKWPHMPVDPSTIAGAMYYVCDSPVLASFVGMGRMGKAEATIKVTQMETKFEFGDMIGDSGVKRVGINGINDDQ